MRVSVCLLQGDGVSICVCVRTGLSQPAGMLFFMHPHALMERVLCVCVFALSQHVPRNKLTLGFSVNAAPEQPVVFEHDGGADGVGGAGLGGQGGKFPPPEVRVWEGGVGGAENAQAVCHGSSLLAVAWRKGSGV